MHVIDPRWAGGRAAEAGQTAVEMMPRDIARHIIIFKQVADQPNAAARAIAFIPRQYKGGASGGAKPAMHAFAQDRVRRGDIRMGQLFRGKLRLHG